MFLEFRRLGPLVPAIWLAHVAIGITAAVSGPALPFLRLNVGQSFSVIGLIFSARSIGFVVASIVTSNVLHRLSQGWHKMAWIAAGLMAMSASVLTKPLINNVLLLIFVYFLYGYGTGMADTADNSLAIFLLGPRKARPFLQSLHFMVAIGAFIAPVIARPFLMQMGANNATHDPCKNDVNASLELRTTEKGLQALEFSVLLRSPLLTLFSICAGMVFLVGLIFVALALRRPHLPHYAGKDEAERSLPETEVFQITSREEERFTPQGRYLLVGMFVLFYFLHAGTENVFWSHTVTFGMCSSLKMDAGDAALLNTVFFAGFLAGRGSGVLFAIILRPGTIISFELAGCIFTTILLAIFGQSNVILVYVAIGGFGFFISMIFASGISWLSDEIDVTGPVSSSWFVGGMSGISAIPLLAGLLIDQPVGPQGMMYFVCGSSLATAATFVSLNFVARFCKKSRKL